MNAGEAFKIWFDFCENERYNWIIRFASKDFQHLFYFENLTYDEALEKSVEWFIVNSTEIDSPQIVCTYEHDLAKELFNNLRKTDTSIKSGTVYAMKRH
jgi:hypothetical protein